MPASRSAWLTRPGRLVALFLAVTLLPAAGLVWLGWVLVAQDQELAGKLLTDRLETEAGGLADRIRHDLDGLDPTIAAPAPDAGALAVTLSAAGIVRHSGAPLVFVPVRPNLPESPPAAWLDGQAAEDRGDYPAAEARYRRLSRSSDAAVRAGALVRLARALRNGGKVDDALAAYAAMNDLDDVAVFDDPASLVAAQARIRTLEGAGRTEVVERERAALRADLARGRWQIDRATFETALVEAGVVNPDEELAERIALAYTVEIIWREWQARPRDEPNRADRRVITVDHGTALAAWSPEPDGLAVLAAAPRFLAARWRALETGDRLAVTIEDGNGRPWLDRGELLAPVVTFRRAESDFPWVIRVASTAPAEDLAAFAGRRRQLLLLPLAAFVMMAAAYFVARAVRRELTAAELQSKFVSAVSHEFRTPLTSISHLVELLGSRPDMDAARRARYYDALEQEAARLRRFVDQLLDFGRADAGAARYRLEPASPARTVEAIVGAFRSSPAARGHDVSVRSEPDLPDVRVDRDALAVALGNLLENAAKYSSDGEPIDVSVEQDPGGRVRVHVRDRGTGIPRNEHGRVFERFVRGVAAETSGVRGTGVGLALARDIVRAHGGEIELESRAGAGSTFTIVLPAVTVAAGQPVANGDAGRSRPDVRGPDPLTRTGQTP